MLTADIVCGSAVFERIIRIILFQDHNRIMRQGKRQGSCIGGFIRYDCYFCRWLIILEQSRQKHGVTRGIL